MGLQALPGIPYIRILLTVVRPLFGVTKMTSQSLPSQAVAARNEPIEVIVKYSGDIEGVASALNAQADVLLKGYAILTIRPELIGRLYTYPEVENIELPKRLYIEDLYNLTSSCIRAVQNPNGYGMTGEGVIVAVIDYGIDYLHRDFRHADGTSRILYLWDQTVAGTPPQGFTEGAEYSAEQINQALLSSDPYSIVPSTDTTGHGTAVAGIAAGNGNEDPNHIGVAPDAELMIVKIGTRGFESFARTTELMRAMKYVIVKARQINRPVVINISFGMNEGSHYGDSLFETYISDISNEWKTSIVVPTGNEGAAGHHYATKLEAGSIHEVTFFVANGIEQFYLSVWKNFVDRFSVEMLYPDGSSSGIVSIDNRARNTRIGNTTMSVVYNQPSHYSVRQEISFNVQATEGLIPSGLWRLRFNPSTIVNGSIELWLPTVEEVTANTRFSEPIETMTMTIPSTAERVVKVAGYNDRIGNIAEFSGVGSLENSAIRPDIAAPAVSIMAPKNGGGYDAYTGTSMAAPFVTGSAALMMQWGIVSGKDPFLYGERLKAFLRLGANRREALVYPNVSYGYGTLCLSNTFRYLVQFQTGGEIPWR